MYLTKKRNFYSLETPWISSPASLMALATFMPGALTTRANFVGTALIPPAIWAMSSFFVGNFDIAVTPARS